MEIFGSTPDGNSMKNKNRIQSYNKSNKQHFLYQTYHCLMLLLSFLLRTVA